MQNSLDIDKNESITKTFWRFAIPSIAAMVVNGLYQVVDGMFVGHFIGYQGLAGINLAWPLIGIVAGLGVMVGMGGGSLVSIFRGEENFRASKAALSTSLGLSVLLGLVASLVLHNFGVWVLTAQGAEGNVLTLGSEYVAVFSWGAMFTVAAAALPMLIRNDNSPNFATGLMVVGAVVNIVLDYLFIGVWDLALEGAAIATLISQLIVVVIALWYFFSHKSQTRLSVSQFKLDAKIGARTLGLGASGLLMFFYFGFIAAVHNKLLLIHGSSVHVGAFAVIGYIGVLYYLTAEGLANGMQPLASYFFGARQGQKVSTVLTIALKSVLVLGILMVVFLNLFPESVVGMFSQGDQALLEATVHGMRLHLFALALDGFIFVASVYFMSVNQGGKALAVSAGNMLIQLPFLYVLPNWIGLDGIWLSVPLSNVVLSLIIAPVLWNDIRNKQGLSPQLATN
ncbi:MATE family efflux transporter [Vibrio sp. SCSIO 43136]|uniref:MATE family efflux transporter n=1 Tax=Vibrio sp. SCSIO 43136 TaxID=2819101 RepID=UPI0020757BEB|nr:MATE family efflux transporter [Vibrio sp. SCSIO 43136]USD67101.1 MATE family efflux transporter [Vibrio sp. SCSIO 43136]